MSGFALKLLLWVGMVLQPPVLPPEPEPPAPPVEAPPVETPPPSDPTATVLPAGLEAVEFPLDGSPEPSADQPLPRMPPSRSPATEGASPTSQAPAERRSIVDLRDPFDRPPVRPRSPSENTFAQQRLLMPDLKDPFADGTRRVRSRTLDLRVPSDLRDPFRDGLGRKRLGPCVRATSDGTAVQTPGTPPIEDECSSGGTELHDPFRGDATSPIAPLPPVVAPVPPAAN